MQTEMVLGDAPLISVSDWQKHTAELRERSDKIRWRRWAKADRLAREAGLEIGVLHNFFVSVEHGSPWEGVDAGKALFARYLVTTMFRASKVVDSISTESQKRIRW